MKTGCKFCDEMPPDPEQPGFYAAPHSEHAASDAAAAYFAREDERCKLEDEAAREVALHRANHAKAVATGVQYQLSAERSADDDEAMPS